MVGHPLRVDRPHGAVQRSVEDDHGRHRLGGGGFHRRLQGSSLHRGQGTGRAGRAAVRRGGMHADGREQFGIGRGQHHRHRTPGGDAGDVDPFGIDAPAGGLLDHLPDDPGENGRLTLGAELVPGAEPIPASLAVVRHRLFRIDDDELVLVRQIVEPGTGGEVKAVLPAAVQRKEHRRLGGPAQADRDVHPVGPGAGHPGESRLTPAALAGRGQRRGRRPAARWCSSGGLAGRRLGSGWCGLGSWGLALKWPWFWLAQPLSGGRPWSRSPSGVAASGGHLCGGPGGGPDRLGGSARRGSRPASPLLPRRLRQECLDQRGGQPGSSGASH